MFNLIDIFNKIEQIQSLDPQGLYIYMCVCIHICIHIYVCVGVCICMYMYIYFMGLHGILMVWLWEIPSGNQAWLAGKPAVNEGFNMNMISKCCVFHCHVWLPEGIDVPIASTCLGPGWFSTQREAPRVLIVGVISVTTVCLRTDVSTVQYPSMLLGRGGQLNPTPDQNKPHFLSHKGILKPRDVRMAISSPEWSLGPPFLQVACHIYGGPWIFSLSVPAQGNKASEGGRLKTTMLLLYQESIHIIPYVLLPDITSFGLVGSCSRQQFKHWQLWCWSWRWQLAQATTTWHYKKGFAAVVSSRSSKQSTHIYKIPIWTDRAGLSIVWGRSQHDSKLLMRQRCKIPMMIPHDMSRWASPWLLPNSPNFHEYHRVGHGKTMVMVSQWGAQTTSSRDSWTFRSDIREPGIDGMGPMGMDWRLQSFAIPWRNGRVM